MKKVLTLFIVSLFAVASVAYAQDSQRPDYEASELVIVEENEIINEDFFGAGEVVEIAGIVNGDVYAAGERVEISGTVNGDVLAAAGIVNISGTVSDDIRVAGGQINVNGIVGKNITAVGGNLVYTDRAEIAGNIVTAGGNVTINSPLKKNVHVAGGNVSIGNIIQGDVTATTGQLTMHPNAQVNGELLHIENMPGDAPDAQDIEGAIQDNGVGVWVFFKLLQFLATLLFGLFLIHMYPKFMKNTSKVVNKQAFKALILGLVSFVAVPIIAVILIATVIGAPLGLLLFGAYGFGLYIARIIFALAIGLEIRKRFSEKWHDGWSFLAGLVVYALISAIPIVGWVFAFVVWWVGLGALMIAKKDLYTELRKKRLI